MQNKIDKKTKLVLKKESKCPKINTIFSIDSHIFYASHIISPLPFTLQKALKLWISRSFIKNL
jgi:hypothetical protein